MSSSFSEKYSLPQQYNVKLWFNANNPNGNNTGLANNTALTTWVGMSGSTATQATSAKRPTFLANSGDSPAFQAVAASSQYYSFTSMPNLTSTNTIMMVSQISSVGNAAYLFGGSGANAGPAFLSQSNPGSGVKQFEYIGPGITNRNTLLASGATTEYHILTVTQTDGSNLTGYIDNTQAFSVTPSGGALAGLHFNYLFTSTNSASFFDNSAKQFLWFDYVLSSTQLTNIWAFLRNLCALTF